MTRNWHIAVQLFALFVQMVMPTIPGVPPWLHETSHALVSFGQAGLAIWTHGLDPSGQRLMPVPQKPKP